MPAVELPIELHRTSVSPAQRGGAMRVVPATPARPTPIERSDELLHVPECARMDSNHHGENSPQGPQPCASTNSATGAEWASIAPGRSGETRPGRPADRAVTPPHLASVHSRRY